MPEDRKSSKGIVSGSAIKDTNVTSTTPEELFDILMGLVEKVHQPEDLKRIEKAYNIAKEAHKEQYRKSGEPYIVHPLCVAIILAGIDMDADTVIGGILHDIVEDTEMTREDVAAEFGEDVAHLVDGVTKLTSFSWTADKADKQAENLRKMFLAMARDIRVVVIKLADRLHNMRTLQYMKPEKQREKAAETRDIYAPIAQRLGISCIKVELDDLAIKYLEPDVYDMLEHNLTLTKEGRDTFIENVVEEITEHLGKYDLDYAHVDGRVKHYFSIYKKMVNQKKTLDQIYDVFAVRIIVDSEKDCYGALGAVHELYKPIQGRFKDYIAMPKENMYRSLHTTVVAKNGQPFEIQIRTWEMHKIAEYGIAAHWRYKEAQDGIKHPERNKMVWLREILELHNDMSDNHEFLSLVKNDLDIFTENVYCFTPKGEPKTLPYGSTIVDFAYSVHTAVGNKMIGAKVNGRITPIDYVIQNGDRIEILTAGNAKGPDKEWLSFAKSAQARSKINQWFRAQNKDDNIIRGKKAIDNYCIEKGINISDIMKQEYIDIVVHKYGFSDWNAILAAIGHGGMKESRIVNKLMEEFIRVNGISGASTKKEEPEEVIENSNGITVKNNPKAVTKLSKCCNPVPGDEIIGYYTKGGVVSIHRRDCKNVLNLNESEQKNLVDTDWLASEGEEIDGKYIVGIDIYSNSRIGILAEVSCIIASRGYDIISLNSRNDKKKGLTILSMSFEIKSRAELKSLTDELKGIDGIVDIQRTTLS